jgi:hypothetical protein
MRGSSATKPLNDDAWDVSQRSKLCVLMEQCQSLKALNLEPLSLDEDHIRYLAPIQYRDRAENVKMRAAGYGYEMYF